VVTEAGFGADLGAEKFIDIKCRKSGIRPSVCVLVATIRALKYQGDAALDSLSQENLPALQAGMVNLEKHVDNITQHYGLPCVVCINRFVQDTETELDAVRRRMAGRGVNVIVAEHWAQGWAGAETLAKEVMRLAEANGNSMKCVYEDQEPLWEKMRKVATRIYGAADISAPHHVRVQIERLQNEGYGHFPICVAKTQSSFSTDATIRGAPQGHIVIIRAVRLSAGAEFVVMICDNIMTMPGLPKVPCATRIDIDDEGRITGLF
jgi:formate--tetrahydrofolate ligase